MLYAHLWSTFWSLCSITFCGDNLSTRSKLIPNLPVGNKFGNAFTSQLLSLIKLVGILLSPGAIAKPISLFYYVFLFRMWSVLLLNILVSGNCSVKRVELFKSCWFFFIQSNVLSSLSFSSDSLSDVSEVILFWIWSTNSVLILISL